jgi:(p)ppGpp synthase/HD superfamily hydrolase
MLRIVRKLLANAGDRESFFDIIKTIYPTLDYRYKMIEKAYDDAKDAFRGVRRVGGERYFEHLRSVALIVTCYLRVKDYRLIVAALLHDIVEDIPSWTIERVKSEYGEDIALLVEWMTKPKRKWRYKFYFNKFDIAPRDFFILKLADRLHNLLTMWVIHPAKIAQKIDETERYFLPYAEKHFILLYELEAIIHELKSALCVKK